MPMIIKKKAMIMNNFDELMQEAAERRRNEEKEGDLFLEDKTVSGNTEFTLYKKRKKEETDEEIENELDKLCSEWGTYE